MADSDEMLDSWVRTAIAATGGAKRDALKAAFKASIEIDLDHAEATSSLSLESSRKLPSVRTPSDIAANYDFNYTDQAKHKIALRRPDAFKFFCNDRYRTISEHRAKAIYTIDLYRKRYGVDPPIINPQSKKPVMLLTIGQWLHFFDLRVRFTIDPQAFEPPPPS